MDSIEQYFQGMNLRQLRNVIKNDRLDIRGYSKMKKYELVRKISEFYDCVDDIDPNSKSMREVKQKRSNPSGRKREVNEQSSINPRRNIQRESSNEVEYLYNPLKYSKRFSDNFEDTYGYTLDELYDELKPNYEGMGVFIDKDSADLIIRKMSESNGLELIYPKLKRGISRR